MQPHLKAGRILKLQQLASEAGKKERALLSASPSEKVILQIELQTLRNAMSLESRSLRKEEWRVC